MPRRRAVAKRRGRSSSISRIFEEERKALFSVLGDPPFELPFCNSVAVGKVVDVKYNLPGWMWPTVGTGSWTIYERLRQEIQGPSVHFLWTLVGDQLSYSLSADYGGKHYEFAATLTAERSYKDDEADHGRRNNRSWLHGMIPTGGSFETWPKNRDRVRLVAITDSRTEVELDTRE